MSKKYTHCPTCNECIEHDACLESMDFVCPTCESLISYKQVNWEEESSNTGDFEYK
jgi:hypothetical protein